MTLLIDLGNTRLKWAKLKADGTLGVQQAALHAGWQSEDFAKSLAKSLKRPAQVWAVSVAAPSVQAKLKRALRALGIRQLHFIESTAEYAGVRNGYHEPWRLGADRWAALLGARAQAPRRTALVVDVGTALTIDVLRADGQHLGGVIVPGVDLMQQSLLRSTGGIERRAGSWPDRISAVSWQAHSTAHAIRYGAELAAAAIIDTAYTEHRKLRPRLLLTGGGGPVIQALIKSPYEWVPDLVLRGLARAVKVNARGAEAGDQG